MHRLLHAAIAPLAALAVSAAAKGVDLPEAPLLKTDAGLTYRAWLPRNFAERRRDVPLILFSHGFGGCAHQSLTLTQALADAGYAVLAPNHHDEGCERYLVNLASAWSGALRPEQPFTQPAAWSDATEQSRRADMQALLDFALTSPLYRDAIDPAHVAAMGHSLGGYTVLGLGGAWESWRDPRIKAVVALSPYAAPFLPKRTLAKLQVPVMFQTGTHDIGLRGMLLKQGGYAMAPAPKYLVEFDGAGHFAWTELNPDYQAQIAAYTIAFLERELMHRDTPLLDQAGGAQVAQYRHDR